MWIDARDPDTGLYPLSSRARIAQRNKNLLTVCSIFGDVSQQIRFDRDLLLDDGVTHTWFGYGEYVGDALQVNWGDNSDEETNFNIDVKFADPLWYGPLVTSATLGANDSPVTITNPGELDAVDSTIVITASTDLVNPTLTNDANDVSFTLTTTIDTGDSVLVDTKYPRIKRTSDQANLIGTVSNVGARSFMVLKPGDNSLQLTASSGTGGAVVTFYPPHY